MTRSALIVGLGLTMASIVLPQRATAAQPVIQVVSVKVAPGMLEPYRQELKKVRGVLTRLGSKAGMRAWITTQGGTDVDAVLVGLEYPDQATWAAEAPRIQADAEWQKIQAGLAKMRTVVSNALWRDISPEASAGGPGSVLVITGVDVKPGKLEDYRQRVGSMRGISERLKLGARTRMWHAELAGPTTGAVAVGVEYPDVAGYVAQQEKLAADPEWQKLLAGLDEVRTVTGRWLYREITP